MSEFVASKFEDLQGQEFFAQVDKGLAALLAFEKDPIAQLANAAAYLNFHICNINWVGFYLLRGDKLVLGPFQGLPACTRLPLGKGVCGSAAQSAKTIVVDDVESFPGHIACDSNSRSEIVVPLEFGGAVVAVLDVDSPQVGRFAAEDAAGVVSLAKTIEKFVNWQMLPKV